MLTELTQEQHDRMPSWADEWIERYLDCTPADRPRFEKGCASCYEFAGIPWHNNVIWKDNPVDMVQYAIENDASITKHNWQQHVFDGGLWLSYVAWESFLHEVCKIETGHLEQARAYRETVFAGLWIPNADFVVVSERPLEIHLEQVRPRGWGSHILHNEEGPALKFRGLDIWQIHGVPCDEQLVMYPETQTISQLSNEQNADLQTIRIERFGWARYLEETNAKCINERYNAIEGTHEALYKLKDGSTRFMAVCPTGKLPVMGVPSSIETCEAASLWLQGNKPFRIVGRT